MHDFHPRSHQSLVLKPGIICKFLIHSGSLQKMLTALFNLVGNTQKSIWTIFFECQGKVILSIEKSGPTLNALPYCFSPHLCDKGVTFLLSDNLRNIINQNWH